MTTTTYNLTENEQYFIIRFLANNGCGAETADSLLGDNYSCQSMEDFNELFENLSDQQIGGYLSSLEQKGVIWADEREGEMCMAGDSLPNLWWATEDYLEALNPNWSFTDADFSVKGDKLHLVSEAYNDTFFSK